MIFRRNGLTIYCYIRKADANGKIRSEPVTSFSADCTKLMDVPKKVLEKLDEKEQSQLVKYFKRQEAAFDRTRERRAKRLPHTQIVAAAKTIPAAFQELDLNAVLEAGAGINEGIAESGYMPEMLISALQAATVDLQSYRLEKDNAIQIIRAWMTFKKEMGKQGYTVAWYNDQKKRRP